MRKHLSTILKIIVTVAGIAIVLSQVDPAELGETLIGADLQWVLVTFVLINASLVLRAYRWLLLLRGLDVDIRFGRLVELYFVGNFFNSFLPTSFGGDVVRVVEVTRDVAPDVAAGTVIVDRLTGLLMLFVMALVALPFRPGDFPANVLTFIGPVSVLGLIAGAVLLEGSLIRRFGGWLPGPLSPVGDTPVAKVLRAVNACGGRAVAGAMAVSVLFNLILTLWWWTAGRALGFDFSFTYLLLVIPILSISLMVPAIGGLGPREAVAQLLFDGATVSLLVYLLQRASGLIGGGVYLWTTLRPGRGRLLPDPDLPESD